MGCVFLRVCVCQTASGHSHQRKKKNTSRPQPALKGETETGIDVKKACWTATFRHSAFGKKFTNLQISIDVTPEQPQATRETRPIVSGIEGFRTLNRQKSRKMISVE